MNVVDYLFQLSKKLDKDLILGPNEQVSYRLIYDSSLKIAAYLRQKVGEKKNILLIGQNSYFFVATYLGIMKSGNTCIPLDPLIEKENLKYILQKTQSKHVFIPQKLISKFSFSNETIYHESLLDQLNEIDLHVLNYNISGDQTAQILFTSGSTGLPKGVMLSHKNIIANTTSIIKYLHLTTEDIIEVVLPFHYCYGLSLLHTHIRVGGSVVLNNTFAFLGSVFNDLEKYKCTGFAGVPSHFQILLRKSKSFKQSKFPYLKYVTQAGGKLHAVFIKEFVETFPDIKFFVMYGQTEATARLSYLPQELVLDKPGSIGKAIPDVELDIFNEEGQPVVAGEVGEIVAKGNNIMSGYLGDPEGTQESLRNGWLHTGDMAIKDEDGYFYLVARKKEIIKVRGKRVSPKEIEEVIVNIPEVVDCTIDGVEDELLGEAIKASIVLTNGTDQDEGRELIQKTCSQKLAAYKIPQLFEFRKNLDVNQAGKKVKKNI